ncbi:hypothetical protein VT84_14450 [Gemmata sp. SH-PL17]|nr:hypothetical protein VT84_14450 [Gemmata sp. SH-PL17]
MKELQPLLTNCPFSGSGFFHLPTRARPHGKQPGLHTVADGGHPDLRQAPDRACW